MRQFTEYLLIALLYGAQVIVQLRATPIEQKLISKPNETTTAIPLRNVTDPSANVHTPTGTTSIPTAATTKNARQFTTTATVDSVLTKLTTFAATTLSASAGYQQETGKRYYDSTTAAPPFVGPVHLYRQFDALSFMGGALLAICLIVIGTMVWKMYIAHVERRYWTL